MLFSSQYIQSKVKFRAFNYHNHNRAVILRNCAIYSFIRHINHNNINHHHPYARGSSDGDTSRLGIFHQVTHVTRSLVHLPIRKQNLPQFNYYFTIHYMTPQIMKTYECTKYNHNQLHIYIYIYIRRKYTKLQMAII